MPAAGGPGEQAVPKDMRSAQAPSLARPVPTDSSPAERSEVRRGPPGITTLPLPSATRERPARRGTGFYPVPEVLLEPPVFVPPPARGAAPGKRGAAPPVPPTRTPAPPSTAPGWILSAEPVPVPAAPDVSPASVPSPSVPSPMVDPSASSVVSPPLAPSHAPPGMHPPSGVSTDPAPREMPADPVTAPTLELASPAGERDALPALELASPARDHDALPAFELGISQGPEHDDLPAPVASTRPFTMPKIVRRIGVPTMTTSTHELESSAELDLPQLTSLTSSAIDTVVASPRAPVSSRPDNFDLDLDDLRDPAGPPAQPPGPFVTSSASASASASRGSLRAPPRPRPLPRITPVAAQPDPPPLASLGLTVLTALLAGLWWFYFSRAPGLVGVDVDAREDMSRRTWPEGYLAAQDERLAADRVGEYQAALAEAEVHGDRLGRAEAALVMHLRYGPDLVRRSAAAVWRKQAGRGDPRADRVAALELLARGEAAEAENALASLEDPRAHLYRALAAQQRGDLEAAAEAARAALAARPDDIAATLVALTTALAARRDTPLTALQSAAEAHPDLPLYQQALMRALLERGHLAAARALADPQKPVVGASDAHNAQLLVLQGQVAAATGEARKARELVDRARRLAPQDLATQLAQVRVLLAIGDPGRAQQELTPLLRASTDPEAMVLQADLAILAGNEGAATRAIDRLAAADDGERERGRISLLRGRVHAMRNRNEDAAAAFTAALNEGPQAAAAIALAELRERLSAAEPLTPVVQTLERMRKDPRAAVRADLRALNLAHANLLYETGRKDQAVTVLDAALAADPDDNACQLRRAVLAIEQGHTPEGRADLDAVFVRTRGFPGLVAPLGRLYLREGNLVALSDLLGTYAEDPQAPDDVVVTYALLRLAQGDRDAAEQNIDKVLQRSPNSWEAHLAKARVLYERERMSEALVEVRLARPRVPDAEVELWTGKISARSGREQEALAAFRKARQLDPSLLEAGYLLGRALLEQGLAREAVTELQTVTRAADVPAGAHLTLGLALREREQLSEALQSFTHAASHDANPEEALYWAGRTAAELGRPAEAVGHLGRAIELAGAGTSWLADAQLWLGRALHGLGRRSEARGPLTAYLQLAGPKAPARAEVEKLLREG